MPSHTLMPLYQVPIQILPSRLSIKVDANNYQPVDFPGGDR